MVYFQEKRTSLADGFYIYLDLADKKLNLIEFCSESSGLSRLAALQGNAPLNILPQILPF